MEELCTSCKMFWFLGISVSLICLIVQIFLYIVLPSSRKLDQKILTQLTIARLGNVIIEYILKNVKSRDPNVKDAMFALYGQTDAALICWMFIFTKNLYDKVILVFMSKKISFVLVSVAIWLLTLPIGLLCPLLLSIKSHYYFNIFYDVYGIVKFIILSLNLLFFFRIFWVAITRKPERDLTGLLRTCVVSFILVCITSLQVFLTDLTTYFGKENTIAMFGDTFSIINSYQVLAITIIFVILSKPSNESIIKTITLRLKAIMSPNMESDNKKKIEMNTYKINLYESNT